MMTLYRCLILGSLFLVGAAQAASVDANLNVDAVRVQATFPSWGNLTADVGLLYDRDGGDVVHAGLMLVDEASAGEDLIAGMGGRIVLVDTDSGQGQAVAVGGFFRYTFPSFNRMGISGQAYFAPDVLAFGDTTRYFELSLRVQYNLLRQGHLYLGWRKVSANYSLVPEANVDVGMHLGMRIEF
jgi:YfaZ precursor